MCVEFNLSQSGLIQMEQAAHVKSWCRALPLERTAAILDSSRTTFGVARIGNITRLDGIGIATVSVVRSDPVGQSVSVCTGKGESELHARVGALAEALERYCAEPRGRIRVITARLSELGTEALSPDSLILPENSSIAGAIDWCSGRRLDGDRVLVPANAVFFPYFPSEAAARLFAANTTGLAVGASLEEALVFALLECIECDAYSRAVALATAGHGEEIAVVDSKSAQDCAGVEIEAVRARAHDILVRDLRCDTDVPCYLCTIFDGSLTHLGVAARPDACQALRAAIQEAAQSRLTDLQGAREDLADRATSNVVDPWFLTGGNAPTVSVRDGWAANSPKQTLHELGTRLRSLEHPVSPVWVDLSLPTVGLTVVRAITPGLEMWAFDPSRVGPRARNWLCPRESSS
jgi:ribosomal protein S12 methylthiotransferase accessory factor